MFALTFTRPFPRPSLTLFVALQMLDILTTLIGLRLGAKESSVFIGHLMQVGPVAGLLISKIMAVFLVAVALRVRRPRVIVFVNFWFAMLVTWNLLMIVLSSFTSVPAYGTTTMSARPNGALTVPVQTGNRRPVRSPRYPSAWLKPAVSRAGAL